MSDRNIHEPLAQFVSGLIARKCLYIEELILHTAAQICGHFIRERDKEGTVFIGHILVHFLSE